MREAVLNALAHRDYGLVGSTVDITIWDDRIEVQSPGPFPGHITLDNMRSEHYSRNRRLMHVLKLFDLFQEYVLSDEVVLRAGGRGVEARSRKRQSLLDEVRRRGSLSTAEAAMFLGEEDRSLVKQLLDDSVQAGEVQPRGRTRARRYYSRR